MFGALAVDVAAAQSDVAQHAIIELPEQVAAPRPFLPLYDLAHQVCQQPRRGRRPPYIAPPRYRNWPTCIDTISRHGTISQGISAYIRIKLTPIQGVNHKLVTM